MSVLSRKNMTRSSADVLNAQLGYEQVFTTTTLSLWIKTLREKHRPETIRCTGRKLRDSLSSRNPPEAKTPQRQKSLNKPESNLARSFRLRRPARWPTSFDETTPPAFSAVPRRSPPFSVVLCRSPPFSGWNMGFCLPL